MLVLFEATAICLKRFIDVDLTLPCLWSLLFNVNCFGCGITRAIEELVFRHNVVIAWQINPLVFAVVPALMWIMIEPICLKILLARKPERVKTYP